ncbi:MAG: FxLYD domain-containing protein [Actinomycetes bacterium]
MRGVAVALGVGSLVVGGLLGVAPASAAASAVVSSSSDWAEGSYRYFAGTVLNNGDVPLDSIKVRLNLYNSSNVLVGTDYTYVQNDVVSPGAEGGYQTITTMPPGYDHATATIEAAERYSSRVANRNFTVTVTNTYSDGYDTHYVGSIRNDNTSSINWVEVRMHFRNSGGGVVGVEFDYAGYGSDYTLAPGESASFDIYRPNDWPAANSYEIYGDASITPASPPAPAPSPTPTASTSSTAPPPPTAPPAAVTPTLAAGLTRSATPANGYVALRGSVSPFRGTTLSLQKLVGSTWSTTSSRTIATSASDGVFEFPVRTSISGISQYRVSASGPGLTSTASAPASLAVYRLAITSVRPTGAERVTLANRGKVPVALRNWVLRDASGKKLRLPQRTLKVGKSLAVYTGAGKSTAALLYLGRRIDVWSRHDIARLVNSSAVVVSKLKY